MNICKNCMYFFSANEHPTRGTCAKRCKYIYDDNTENCPDYADCEIGGIEGGYPNYIRSVRKGICFNLDFNCQKCVFSAEKGKTCIFYQYMKRLLKVRGVTEVEE